MPLWAICGATCDGCGYSVNHRVDPFGVNTQSEIELECWPKGWVRELENGESLMFHSKECLKWWLHRQGRHAFGLGVASWEPRA